MNVLLLGGSNSVVHCGLKTGLVVDKSVKLKNKALGASSSLQNLNELIEEIEAQNKYNLIISESNVNDSYNFKYLNAKSELITKNIDLYYRELSLTGVPVCVILYPINFNLVGAIESKEMVKIVNEAHKKNCRKFGFYLIDLSSVFSGFSQDVLGSLMPDSRHPKPLYMHQLGINVIKYFSTFREKKINSFGSRFVRMNLDDFPGFKRETKENSIFRECLVELDKEYVFPKKYTGYQLLGIGTWCDENSPNLLIRNESVKVIKSFNKDKAFNELVEPICLDGNTKLSFSSDRITERSINTPTKKPPYGKFLAYSILLCKDDGLASCEDNDVCENVLNDITNQIIPNANIFVYDSNYLNSCFLKNNNITNVKDLDDLVLLSEKIEEIDPKLALDVLLIVKKYYRDDKVVSDRIKSLSAV